MNTDRAVVKKGDKVSLIVPEKEDFLLWYRWINNPKINQYLANSTKVYSLEAEEQYYYNSLANPNNIKFGIYANKDKKLIGSIDLMNISHVNKNSLFGVMIGEEDYLSKGYGTEAIKLFLDYAFKVQGLKKVYGSYIAINERAGHVYKNIGFKEIGVYKKQFFRHGDFHDQVLVEIFKEEFYKVNREFV